jgi:Streptomyces sporulation and cell division protein, SsgA
MQASPVIQQIVCADLVRGRSDRRAVMIELSYDAADPYAVRLAVSTGDAPGTWAIGRDLLSEGMTRPVGEGEARIWTSPFGPRQVVWIRFTRQPWTALIELAMEDLTEFVDQTYKLVPAGSEPLFIDVDSLIDGLIRDAS